MCELYFNYGKDEKEIKKRCVCVLCCVVFYLLNYLCCLIKKKIQIKIKNVCVFFVHGQISVFPKIYLRFNNKFIKSYKFG